jgi:hypothetical protein
VGQFDKVCEVQSDKASIEITSRCAPRRGLHRAVCTHAPAPRLARPPATRPAPAPCPDAPVTCSAPVAQVHRGHPHGAPRRG